MSEPTLTPPTLRLLEPRALLAADRIARGVADRAAPMLRSLSTGVGRLTDRVFDFWIGRTEQARTTSAATRGPQQLGFPAPWYEHPEQRTSENARQRRPLWPTRGIELAAPPAREGNPEEPRAKDFIARYVEAYRGDDAGGETSVGPGPTVPSIVAASGGEASLGRTNQLVPSTAAAPTSVARPSLISRLVERLQQADAMVQRTAPTFSALLGARAEAPVVSRNVAAPSISYVTAAPFSADAAPDGRLSIGAPSQVARVAASRPIVASASVPSSDANPSVSMPSTVGPSLAVSSTTTSPSQSASSIAIAAATTSSYSAGPATSFVTASTWSPRSVGLDAALPLQSVAPSVQRFVERLTGPRALAQAGEVSPLRAALAYSREMVAPSVSESTKLQSPVMQPSERAPVPRDARRADAVRLGEATSANASVSDAAPTSTNPPLGEAVRVAELPRADEARATAVAATPSAASSAPSLATWPATWIGEREALLSPEPQALAWMPGRFAQDAELLATVAERRVARQLGLPQVVTTPSVQRSADAFAPASWSSTPALAFARPETSVRVASRVFDASNLALPSLAVGSSAAPSGVAAGRFVGPSAAARSAPTMPTVAPSAGASPAAQLTASTTSSAVASAFASSVAPSDWAPMSTRTGDAVLRAPQPAPMSIASILAFADAQLGSQLLRAAQPLPLTLPTLVYTHGVDAPTASSPASSASVVRDAMQPTRARAPLGTLAAADMPAAVVGAPNVRELGAEPRVVASPGMPLLESPLAPRIATAHETFGLGQQGRRSERWAGELGARAASLASDFLPSLPTMDSAGFSFAQPAMPQVAAAFSEAGEVVPAGSSGAARQDAGTAVDGATRERVQQAGISSAEWMLLSLFPSAATVQEVARSVSSRSAPALSYVSLSESPLASARPAMGPASIRARSIGPSPEAGIQTWVDRANLSESSTAAGASIAPALPMIAGADASVTSGTDASSSFAQGTPAARLGVAAPSFAWVTGGAEASSRPVAQANGSRPSLTVALPDGRRPRGNRLASGPSMPMLHAVAAASAAAAQVSNTSAAEQRVETPVSAPLWGHLRSPLPVVSPEAQRAQNLAHTASHTAALELVTPYLEAARPAERSMAATTFAQQPTPSVAAQPSNAATQSLVTALSSSAGQSSGDRLSLADLTLISIISATEQVAASPHGAAPSHPTPPSVGSGAGTGSAGGANNQDEDAEVELIAERAFGRLMVEIRQYLDNKGEPWER